MSKLKGKENEIIKRFKGLKLQGCHSWHYAGAVS